MKRILRYPTITLFSVLIFTNCASTIKKTGIIQYDSKINKINIICNGTSRIAKFSNDLCTNLKANLEGFGLTATTYITDEMTPSLDSDSIPNIISKDSDIEIKITHIRIYLINGMAIYQNRISRPIWVARIKTEGSNITGPGNPKKVSMEIINRMKLDGFKF
jgi:hypothetical protein